MGRLKTTNYVHLSVDAIGKWSAKDIFLPGDVTWFSREGHQEPLIQDFTP